MRQTWCLGTFRVEWENGKIDLWATRLLLRQIWIFYFTQQVCDFRGGCFKNYVIFFKNECLDLSIFHRNLILNAKLKVSPFPPPLIIFLVLAKRGILTQFINFYCFEKNFLPFVAWWTRCEKYFDNIKVKFISDKKWLTLYWYKSWTRQVKMASLETGTVTFKIGAENFGSEETVKVERN